PSQFWITQQTVDRPAQLRYIAHPLRGACFDCAAGCFLEIERMRTDDDRNTDSTGLQQVLAAQREQAAADKCDIACGVVREHLTHRVAEDNPRLSFDRTIFAAELKLVPALSNKGGDLIESLRVARHDNSQQLRRCRFGERIPNHGLLAFARARGKEDGSRAK